MGYFLFFCLVAIIAFSIFSSKKKRPHPTTQTATTPAVSGSIDGPGEFDFDLVGESFYQDNLAKICGPKSEGTKRVFATGIIIPYDTNPHDPLAVRVEIKGLVVGHFAKEAARQYRKQLQKSGAPPYARMSCDAMIVGGWITKDGKEASYGVKLDIPTE